MLLPPPRHWDWWTTRPPCGNSNGTSSSSGTLAARSSTTQRQPLRSLRCMHRSTLRAASCARIAATGVRVGRVERAGSTCTSSASGTPTTCSLSWAWWGGTRRSWGRSLCHPYPWDQCEPWWNNRVGWTPNCEDTAHCPPPPQQWYFVPQHFVRVVRVARVFHSWISMCPRSHTNSFCAFRTLCASYNLFLNSSRTPRTFHVSLVTNDVSVDKGIFLCLPSVHFWPEARFCGPRCCT